MEGITLRNRARKKTGEIRRQIRNGKRMEQVGTSRDT